ncbi:MAG: hypothetical protein KAW82_02645 [Desulfurellaceae bacterium]|nr:hypothetical protein [Desulfurellaceae bacterium]
MLIAPVNAGDLNFVSGKFIQTAYNPFYEEKTINKGYLKIDDFITLDYGREKIIIKGKLLYYKVGKKTKIYELSGWAEALCILWKEKKNIDTLFLRKEKNGKIILKPKEECLIYSISLKTKGDKITFFSVEDMYGNINAFEFENVDK